MTGLEVPIYAAIGIISMAVGAGGTFAVVKKQANQNESALRSLELEFKAHTRADAIAFNEIMRALGRIEGKLDGRSD